MDHDLAWADAHPGEHPFLGEIWALALVRGLSPEEALRRVGALPDTLAPRTPEEIGRLHVYEHGYPEVTSALSLGEWTVLCQPTSFWLVHVLDALSRGTEAVGVLRHDYASPGFEHCVDGVTATAFDPYYPPRRWGSRPDALLAQMRQAGFDPEDEDGQYDETYGRSLRLAGLITGVLPAFAQLTGPLTSAHVDTWFSHRKPTGDLPADPCGAAEAIVAELGLTRTPGLAEALAAARRGEPVVVTPDSVLGRRVRAWSEQARVASWSLNDPWAKFRLSEQERDRAFRLGHLTDALAKAFRADLA